MLSKTERMAHASVRIFPAEFMDIPALGGAESCPAKLVEFVVNSCFQVAAIPRRTEGLQCDEGYDVHCYDFNRYWSEIILQFRFFESEADVILIDIYASVDTPFLSPEEQEANDKLVLDALYGKTKDVFKACIEIMPDRIFIVSTEEYRALTSIHDPFPTNELIF